MKSISIILYLAILITTIFFLTNNKIKILPYFFHNQNRKKNTL